jgi:O-antigen/teichoic acid export membrane protein
MSISKHATYNLVGAALPSLLTLITVPLYLNVVGVERYGLLALCWIFLGYSGFLDLGLGLAVAKKLADIRGPAAGTIFWTSLWLSLCTGLIGAAAIYLGATYYFSRVAEVATSFRAEALGATPFIAAIVPTVMLASVLNGALQGRERFLVMNVAGAFGHTCVAGLPLLVAYFWKPELSALLAGAVAARLAPLPCLYASCRSAVPFGAPMKPDLSAAKGLLSFGGWVSIGTVANGFLASADRLIIGTVRGPAAVAVYAIPYSLVSRIIIIPHSLAPALFPRYASADAAERARLMANSIGAVASLVTPISIALLAITHPFFTLWIGPELAPASAPLAYVLTIGFWIYCIGYPASSMLQAKGRPDIVSKLFAFQLVPYAAAMLFAIWLWGVFGAALVVTIRAAIECYFLLVLAGVRWSTLRALMLPASLIIGAVAAAAILSGPIQYGVLAALLLASLVWTLNNAPDSVRPFLERIASRLPSRHPRG